MSTDSVGADSVGAFASWSPCPYVSERTSVRRCANSTRMCRQSVSCRVRRYKRDA